MEEPDKKLKLNQTPANKANTSLKHQLVIDICKFLCDININVVNLNWGWRKSEDLGILDFNRFLENWISKLNEILTNSPKKEVL